MFSLTRIAIPRLLKPVSSGTYLETANISSSAVLRLFPRLHGDPMLEVGPWPRTKEEHDIAAKKYNLIPEDYEPHDYDDAYGDYPKLKPIGAFNRDPYDDFDDIGSSRFHGEVYHKDYDMYLWERFDPLEHEKETMSVWTMLAIFIGLAAFIPTFDWLTDRYRINVNHPFKQRRPYPNRILYEFPSSAS